MTHIPFSILSMLALMLIHAAGQGTSPTPAGQNLTVDDPGETITLSLPPGSAQSPSDLLLANGATVAAAAIPILALDKTVHGMVVLGAANLYHFSGPANSDYFVTLYPIGSSSDPDLYCSPYQGIFLNFGPPSPLESVWASAAPVGADYVFISQNDSAFEAAINASGVAEFVCAVYGASVRGAQYSLTATMDTYRDNLAQPEQAALASIYQRCCTPSPGSCQYWDAVSSDAGVQLYTDFCNYGLSVCNANGSLIKLDMTQMGLSCEFPYAEMQAFQSLTSISFQENTISGDVEAIGASLKGLIGQLTYLDLSFNLINGSFAALIGLVWEEDRDIVDAAYAVIFSKFLVGAKGRGVYRFWDGVPGGQHLLHYGTGSTLQALFLNINNLTAEIPSSIPAALALQALALGNNALTGSLPPTLGSAAGLTMLSLENNKLTGTIPAAVASLPQLQSIRLYNNSLTGAMPEELGASKTLEEIDVGYNALTAVPQSWLSGDALSSVIAYIGMDNNALAGGFPAALSSCQNLTVLLMDNNNFSGNLPTNELAGESTFFPSLILFNASDNHFQGSLPAAFGQIGFFQQDDNTDVVGVDKLEASQESNLESLTHGFFSLAGNLLTGSLPAFLSRNQVPDVSMGSINLQDNQFGCPIPGDMQYLNVSCGATVLPPSGTASPPGGSSGFTGNEQPDSSNSQPSWSAAGLSGGAKAGIAIAVIIVVVGGAVLLGLCLPRYRKASRGWEKQALDQQFPLRLHGSAVEMSNGRQHV